MGKQTSFYATPKETVQLIMLFQECGPLTILHSRAKSSFPEIVPFSEFEERCKDWLYFFLVRESDVESVRLKEVPSQFYWAVDSLRSPVVELTCGFYSGERLRAGRLHYDGGFYDESGIWTTKPASFLEWAECVVGGVKKNLKKEGNYYIGKGAADLRDASKVIFLK